MIWRGALDLYGRDDQAAAILDRSRHSFILDEIERGTSTFDGLSIAWATVEHLVTRLGCRCLFATHYLS